MRLLTPLLLLLPALAMAEEPITSEQLMYDISSAFKWKQSSGSTIKDGSRTISVSNFNNFYEICTPFTKEKKIHFTNFKPYRDYRDDHILSAKGKNSGCFKITSINLLDDMSRARSMQIVSLEELSIEIDLLGFTEALNKIK